MTQRHSLQSVDSSFDDPLTVHPWRILVDNLCQSLVRDVYTQFLFFSKDLLSKDDYQRFASFDSPENYLEYFSTLEDCLGENGAVEHLEHLISKTEYHGGDFGEVDYKEWIKIYREEKKEYLKEINPDPNFDGRELLLKDVLKNLRQGYKGVVLCGISGIGKTSLAYQVCSRLEYSKEAWNIIIVNQREKSDLNGLLVELISDLSKELCIAGHTEFISNQDLKTIMVHCQTLFAEMAKKQLHTMICLDNMDGHCETRKQHAFFQIMKGILSKVPLNSNVKFLMTVGKKLSNITQMSNERNVILDGQMIEQEVKPVTPTETAKILRKISHKSENELPDSICNKVHSLCGGIPFYISMAGDLIKSGYTADTLQHQRQTIPMDTFLEKSFQMLEQSPQLHGIKTLLVRLSVFQTARFNIQAAVSVGHETCMEEKFQKPAVLHGGMLIKDPSAKDNMWIKLQQLKSHFLLEVHDALSSLGKLRRSSEKLYSLHPLVVGYMTSFCYGDERLKEQKALAKVLFLKHFCAEIVKIGEICDKDSLKARTTMDENIVHIKEFFKIIRKENLLLSDYMPQKDASKHKLSASVAVQRRHIWKVADLAISSLERKLFARNQADIEEKAKNLFSYIYWRSLEAESLLTQDKIQLTVHLLDSMTSELGIVTDGIVCAEVDDWNKPPDEEIPAWATFYTMKGRLYFQKGRNNNEYNMLERSMEFVTIAERWFEGRVRKGFDANSQYSNKYFQTDIADVKNLKGCVYFLLKNYDKSKQCHEKAYSIIRKLTDNMLHKNLSEYQTNMAACLYQMGLGTSNRSLRNELFKEALNFYDQSVENNKRLKCEMMPSQAGTLRNRAEIYYRQEQLDKALSDGKEVLQIVRNLYVAPHIEITLALERLAYYHFKIVEIGRMKHTDMNVEDQNHLKKAIQLYDKVLMQICNGGLPIENNNTRTYKLVRDNHRKVMQLLKYEQRLVDDRLRDYQAFEEGKINKNIKHNLQHDLDIMPKEFLQEAITEGAMFVPHKMDDSDTESSETSSSEASRSSSSSKSGSPSDNSPHQLMEVEQVLKLKRHDSGVEETEFSDEEIKAVDMSDTNDTKYEKSKLQMDTDEDKLEVNKILKRSGSEEKSVFVDNTVTENEQQEVRKKPSSSLIRQASVDLPDVMELDGSQGEHAVELRGPSASSYADSARESCSSSASSFESWRKSSTNELRDSWRGSGLSSSFGSQKHNDLWSCTGSDSGAQKRRKTWSSTGSQDSVTSQIGHKLNLEDLEENIEENEENSTLKRKKTEHHDEKSNHIKGQPSFISP